MKTEAESRSETVGINALPFAVDERSMITQAGIVNQKIDGRTAFVQPIAETFHLGLVSKIKGLAEQLQLVNPSGSR